MAFWTDQESGNYEPLRSYRWVMNFSTDNPEDIQQFTYGLKECQKPSYEISITEHKHISGHVFRYPGTLKWNPINVKFASVTNQTFSGQNRNETQGQTLTGMLQNVINKFGYNLPHGNNELTDNFQQFSKDKLKNIAGSSLDIIQIDEVGLNQEIWTLYNPFISKIEYGNLSYASDDIVEVNMTIQYDYATINDYGNYT